MPQPIWQKSSYCGEGDSCVHVAATPRAIHTTESADPGGAALTTTSDAFRGLLRSLEEEPHRTTRNPVLEVTVGDDSTVRLHAPGASTVTTDRRRWKTFVRGVRAGEFDHFVAEDGKGRDAHASRVNGPLRALPRRPRPPSPSYFTASPPSVTLCDT